MVKNGCFNEMGFSSSEINFDLEKMRSNLQGIFREFEIADEMPTVEQIKDKYKIASGKVKIETPEKVSFFDRYKEFIDTTGRQNAWSTSSYYKHNSVKHLLEQYNPHLTFEELTDEELQNILDFMRDKRGIRNTTLNKYLRFIKQFLLWADLKGYLTNQSYKRYKPKLKGANFDLKKVIYLDWEELMNLYMMEISNTRLAQVRDVFCFCCFTGLRYSDVYNLKKTDIKDTKIDIVTIKDVDNINIELNKYSRAILDKYKDLDIKKGKALPVISNQNYNDYLKELGQLAEMNEEMTEVWYVGSKRMERTVKKNGRC
ncbi:phage integrase SAM-like domain-containing protein [Parabacteroides chongii]|nr:phage integrase SAM-like domain-containing protein [Parabacteroides chongii]WFE84911.1 phage integrase SAM-like domain-containing protein [Parabacteroides chongii]